MGIILDRIGKQMGPVLSHAAPAKVLSKPKRKKRKARKYGK